MQPKAATTTHADVAKNSHMTEHTNVPRRPCLRMIFGQQRTDDGLRKIFVKKGTDDADSC